MESGRALDLLIETREDVASMKKSIEQLCREVEKLSLRVQALEDKPAQRYNTGVTAAISSVVGAVVAYVITLVTRR